MEQEKTKKSCGNCDKCRCEKSTEDNLVSATNLTKKPNYDDWGIEIEEEQKT